LIVAGVMSGTSADGINVALVHISGRGFRTRLRLLAHREYPYPAAVRQAVLATMNAQEASVADLSRLNFFLGDLYADAVLATERAARKRAELIGCHGQTIYHQGEDAPFLGKKLATTWQTGEGSVIAARTKRPVVSDFRPADMAGGGKGAPLVPFLDYVFYRDPRRGRILQNIGGIANLTAIPPAARPDDVVAFDTGPGNMVIDAVVEQFWGKKYDHNGQLAARGKVLEPTVADILRDRFFHQRPPKTAGREEFGREFVDGLIARCKGARSEDIVATATALTASSIVLAIRRFVLRGPAKDRFRDFVVAGGGSKNPTLMRMVATQLEPLGLTVRHSDEFGIPSEAKEAVAFALLAYQTWHRQPGNIPSATGASRPAVLGKISYA